MSCHLEKTMSLPKSTSKFKSKPKFDSMLPPIKWTKKIKKTTRTLKKSMKNTIKDKIILKESMNLILRKIWKIKFFPQHKNQNLILRKIPKKKPRTSPWTTSLLSHKAQRFSRAFTWKSFPLKRKNNWMCSSATQTESSFQRYPQAVTQIPAILPVLNGDK